MTPVDIDRVIKGNSDSESKPGKTTGIGRHDNPAPSKNKGSSKGMAKLFKALPLVASFSKGAALNVSQCNECDTYTRARSITDPTGLCSFKNHKDYMGRGSQLKFKK